MKQLPKRLTNPKNWVRLDSMSSVFKFNWDDDLIWDELVYEHDAWAEAKGIGWSDGGSGLRWLPEHANTDFYTFVEGMFTYVILYNWGDTCPGGSIHTGMAIRLDHDQPSEYQDTKETLYITKIEEGVSDG